MTFKPNALNTSNYVCQGQEIEDCNERAEVDTFIHMKEEH